MRVSLVIGWKHRERRNQLFFADPYSPTHTACYLLFGATFLPGGNMWAVLVVWLGAQVRERVVDANRNTAPSFSPSLTTHPPPLP